MDRLLHHAHLCVTRGDSVRLSQPPERSPSRSERPQPGADRAQASQQHQRDPAIGFSAGLLPMVVGMILVAKVQAAVNRTVRATTTTRLQRPLTGRQESRPHPPFTLDDMAQAGFLLLEERQGTEIVFG